MAIPKVVGTETEYGIFGPSTPDFNPVLASSFLINAYAGNLRRIRWDYEQESPLRDARGYEPVQERQPVDEELGLANVILPNGARYYVDHAHPEYSTPECAGPRELVVHDKAGELVLERSLEAVQAMLPPGERIAVYKNNTDGKGNSYGTHENYLVDRRTPFTRVVRDLTPFFVTRQIFTGAGKLGSESARGSEQRIVYQLTQRADFFEAEVGLETTLKRPIINTRDEPHADPEKYRRLHVIIGDANMNEVSTFLKVGTTALVLAMIEAGFVDRDLTVEAPVSALRAVSHDHALRHQVTVRDAVVSDERQVVEDAVTLAMTTPPEDTRAYFRGRCLAKYPAEVAAASWDSVIFDVGRDSLQRVPTMEPLRGTKAHVGDLLDQ